ncbi:MAG TPA: hypothetical protein PLR73_05805 [Acetivibrio sp.]|nr:hypothetical protein [Acetivibrio sp.]
MIDTIEIKDSVQDSVNGFVDIKNSFNDIKSTMTVINGLLMQNNWEGDAKKKCVQIQGLLEKYGNEIAGLVDQLSQETAELLKNKSLFVSNSDSVRIISTI